MNKQESHKQSIIRVVEPGELMEVISASGKTYKIRYCGSGDGDPEYIAIWKCNCPAGSHGHDCKHMRAFLDSRLMDYGGDEDDEEDGIPQEIEF